MTKKKVTSKHYEEQDIDSMDNLFKKAHQKISAFYTLSIVGLMLLFSILVYALFAFNLTHRTVSLQNLGQTYVQDKIKESKQARVNEYFANLSNREMQAIQAWYNQVSMSEDLEDDLDDLEDDFSDDIQDAIEEEVEKELEAEGIMINNFQDSAKRNLIETLAILNMITGLSVYFIGRALASKTLAPIKESVTKQKKFVSDVSHELRNPLAIMKTAIETVNILDQTSEEEKINSYKETFCDLHIETDRLISICNDLLFLAKSDQNTVNKRLERFNFSEICKRQIKFISAYATKKDVFLKTKIDPDVFVKANKEQIGQLLTNLLKNAIDYNKKNGSVTLVLKNSTDNKVRLVIEDTGIGIKQQDLNKIFDRFYKVDQARNLNKSGSGLGLSIVNEIIKINNAKLNIDSTSKKGTKIVIEF